MGQNFKTNGIKGTTSKIERNRRIDLCRQLYVSNPSLSATDFETAFITLLKANKIAVPASPKTLKKIYKDAKIVLNKNSVELDEDILLSNLRDDIEYYISQIRITCKSYEIKLYDIDNVPDDALDSENFIDKNIFLAPLAKLKEKKDNKKIGLSTLTTIYLILNTQGFENHIADILEKELKANNECLYIETHRFCVKIILEYKDLAIVAEKMYKLIGYIPFKPSDNS